jgi:hypothetical protein
MLKDCELQTLLAFYNSHYEVHAIWTSTQRCSEIEEILNEKPFSRQRQICTPHGIRWAQSSFAAVFVDSSSTLASFAPKPGGSVDVESDLSGLATQILCVHAVLEVVASTPEWSIVGSILATRRR